MGLGRRDIQARVLTPLLTWFWLWGAIPFHVLGTAQSAVIKCEKGKVAFFLTLSNRKLTTVKMKYYTHYTLEQSYLGEDAVGLVVVG